MATYRLRTDGDWDLMFVEGMDASNEDFIVQLNPHEKFLRIGYNGLEEVSDILNHDILNHDND